MAWTDAARAKSAASRAAKAMAKGRITVYHGTSSYLTPLIRRKGLVASLGVHARKPSVYVTNSKGMAELFARRKSIFGIGGRPTVLTIQVPRRSWSTFKPDKRMGRGMYRRHSTIPAKWIR